MYEEIMRGAEARMRAVAQIELEKRRQELGKHGAKLKSLRLNKAEETRCVIEQIDVEISNLSAQMARISSMEKRIELKAAIVHLRETRERIIGGNRKPPESGVAVPAVPPRGPLPKQGGAAASLDFRTD